MKSPESSVPSPEKQNPKQFKSPTIALSFVLVLFGIFRTWSTVAPTAGMDFYQFWIVGQALNRPGVTNWYSEQGHRGLGAEFLEMARQAGDPLQLAVARFRQELQIYSSPFLYATFRMLSTGNYTTDLRNYRLLVIFCLISSIVILGRLLEYSWETTLPAIAVFSTWFGPFLSDMYVGNVNTLQLAPLAFHLWMVNRTQWPHREILGGVIFGLAVAFKPNVVLVPSVLTLHWLFTKHIRRMWFHAIGALVGLGIAIGIAALTFGSVHCWIDWLSALRSLPDQFIQVAWGNYALAWMLSEWCGVNMRVPLAIAFGSLLVLVMWKRRQGIIDGNDSISRPNVVPEIFALSLGCLFVVLIPQLAWLHYYVFTIPAFLLLFLPLSDSPSEITSNLWRCFLVTLAILGFAGETFVSVGIKLSAHAQGLIVILATLIVFGLILSQRYSKVH